ACPITPSAMASFFRIAKSTIRSTAITASKPPAPNSAAPQTPKPPPPPHSARPHDRTPHAPASRNVCYRLLDYVPAPRRRNSSALEATRSMNRTAFSALAIAALGALAIPPAHAQQGPPAT